MKMFKRLQMRSVLTFKTTLTGLTFINNIFGNGQFLLSINYYHYLYKTMSLKQIHPKLVLNTFTPEIQFLCS